MGAGSNSRITKLSVVIPCYNEAHTLKRCVEGVLEIADANLELELIIVDDHSTDTSHAVAVELEQSHQEITVVRHEKNYGKGAALRTGFKMAGGDFAAVQDADLEYDPQELKRLIVPLIQGKADVVLGSRFLSAGTHRVLYFWHAVGNRFLTLLSNMFTDLNLTDMESCYKVFRTEVIQAIDIQENRFGFEPEIIAKIAQMRLRIYEMGISYYGRTYAEGKKIGARDGFRALYCILRYNAHRAPLPIQLLIYLNIGAAAALVNFLVFISLMGINVSTGLAAPIAFITAAIVNYMLCVLILFRHRARWHSLTEVMIYLITVAILGGCDLWITQYFITIGAAPGLSKIIATLALFLLNFMGRRFLVFPEPATGPWKS